MATTVWTETMTTDGGSAANYHIRDLIRAVDITDVSNVKQVRVKFEAPTATNLDIDLAYLGQRDGATWNIKSSPAKVKLTFSGSDSVVISGGTTQWSDWVDWTGLDGTDDLLVSVDYGSAMSQSRYVFESYTANGQWAGTDGAANDAAPGGGTSSVALYFVVEIQVETAGGRVSPIFW